MAQLPTLSADAQRVGDRPRERTKGPRITLPALDASSTPDGKPAPKTDVSMRPGRAPLLRASSDRAMKRVSTSTNPTALSFQQVLSSNTPRESIVRNKSDHDIWQIGDSTGTAPVAREVSLMQKMLSLTDMGTPSASAQGSPYAFSPEGSNSRHSPHMLSGRSRNSERSFIELQHSEIKKQQSRESLFMPKKVRSADNLNNSDPSPRSPDGRAGFPAVVSSFNAAAPSPPTARRHVALNDSSDSGSPPRGHTLDASADASFDGEENTDALPRHGSHTTLQSLPRGDLEAAMNLKALRRSRAESPSLSESSHTSTQSLDPRTRPWYQRLHWLSENNELETAVERAELMQQETVMVEDWAKEMRHLVELNTAASARSDAAELQSLIELTKASQDARVRKAMLVEVMASVANPRERIRLKRGHKYELLRTERDLIMNTELHRRRVEEDLWQRIERRHKEFGDMFDSGPELVMRFGDLLAAAARAMVREHDNVLESRLLEEGMAVGKAKVVEAKGNLVRKLALNPSDCSPCLGLVDVGFTAVHNDIAHVDPAWGMVRADDCPYKTKRSLPAPECKLLDGIEPQVVKANSLAALRMMAEVLDACHPTFLVTDLVSDFSKARSILQARLDLLGYEIPGGRLNLLTREVDTKIAVIDVMRQLRVRLGFISEFYFEVHPETRTEWVVGWTLNVLTPSLYPGADGDSFGLSSRGVIIHNNREYKFCDPLMNAMIIGASVNMRSGAMSFFADGAPLGVAFGADAVHFDVETQIMQAVRLRQDNLQPVPAIAVRGLVQEVVSTPARTGVSKAPNLHSSPSVLHTPANSAVADPSMGLLTALSRAQRRSSVSKPAGAPILRTPQASRPSSPTFRVPGSIGRRNTSADNSRPPSPTLVVLPLLQPRLSVNFGALPFCYLPRGATSCNCVLRFETADDLKNDEANRAAIASRKHDRRAREAPWLVSRERLVADLNSMPVSWSTFPPTTHRNGNAARILQRAYRRFRARLQRRALLARMTTAARKLQRWWRHMRATVGAARKAAAIMLQAMWRRHNKHELFKLYLSFHRPLHVLTAAAKVLQRAFRRSRRRRNEHRLATALKNEIGAVMRAADSIQRLWRSWRFYRTVRQAMARWRGQIVVIQAWWRGVRHRRGMDKRTRARAKRAAQMIVARRPVIRVLELIMFIQKWWRAVLRRRHESERIRTRIRAAIRLQALWRGWSCRANLPERFDTGQVRYLAAVATNLAACHYVVSGYPLTHLNP